MMKILKVNKSSLKSRTINIPGDKSISHRAIILLSLASNSSTIRGLLEAEDCLHTIRIMQELGVKIYKQGEEYIIEGVGLNGLTKPKKELYCGNSGTAMRLISGILAGQDFESKLTGDTSLLSRPMERVSEPLKLMGANLTLENKEKAPINFKPAKLTGINYEMNIDSAQQKSLIILASMYANSKTRIKQKNLTRDHTENLLKYFDYDININQQYIEINPNKEVSIKYIRNGGTYLTTTVLESRNINGNDLGYLGVSPVIEQQNVGIINSAIFSTKLEYEMTLAAVDGIFTLLSPENIRTLLGTYSGQEIPDESRPLSPIGLAQAGSQIADNSYVNLFSLLAFVNVFLAVFNAIPLIPLDGGRVLLSVIEGITGKKIPDKKLYPIAAIVIFVFVFIGITAFYLDITQPINL